MKENADHLLTYVQTDIGLLQTCRKKTRGLKLNST